MRVAAKAVGKRQNSGTFHSLLGCSLCTVWRQTGRKWDWKWRVNHHRSNFFRVPGTAQQTVKHTKASHARYSRHRQKSIQCRMFTASFL